MEAIEQIKFDSILAKIQNCSHLEENKMKLFFDDCFDDLSIRMEVQSDNSKQVGKIIFNRYLNIPVIVSDKIFSVFRSEI